MTQPSSKRLVTEASLAPAITNAVAPIKNLTDPTFSAALSATFAPVILYANGSYATRPSGAVSVTWIGPVQPPAMTTNDTWVDNS